MHPSQEHSSSFFFGPGEPFGSVPGSREGLLHSNRRYVCLGTPLGATGRPPAPERLPHPFLGRSEWVGGWPTAAWMVGGTVAIPGTGW